jgi:hypothetical protein
MRLQTRSGPATIMIPSPDTGDGNMKRAILIALGAGLVISSAAALDIAGAGQPAAPAAALGDPIHAARLREGAREDQRTRIQERYLVEREQCAELRGYRREKCVVRAHANRGRALLEAGAPYETRF